jgi:hypothetical protein
MSFEFIGGNMFNRKLDFMFMVCCTYVLERYLWGCADELFDSTTLWAYFAIYHGYFNQ